MCFEHYVSFVHAYICCFQPQSLRTWYFNNRMHEFHHISNFAALGNKDELVKFWGQKVKVTTSQVWS